MNNREHYEFMRENGLIKGVSRESRITILVNNLLSSLTIPTKGEHINSLDSKRVEEFGLDNTEPINWAGLGVAAVKKRGKQWDVIIEEASPNECPKLCSWIEEYMNSWGWDVNVYTEW